MSTEFLTRLERASDDAVLAALAVTVAAKRIKKSMVDKQRLDINALAVLKDRYAALGRAIKYMRDSAQLIAEEPYR